MEADQVRLIEGTNTQTRNLTVLISILSLINKDVIPLSLLELKAREWDKKTAETSSSYRSRSGRLTNKAFKYYVNLTEDLGLITRYNAIIRCSRDGLIYCLLSKTMDQEIEPGKLLFFQKLFFLYILLHKDADYLIPILEIVSNNNGLREAEIRQAFRERIIQRFQKKALSTNLKVKVEAEKKYRDLKLASLSTGKHSLKHHIPNRLIWLYDLELLAKSGVYFFISHGGERLLELLYKIETSKGVFHDLDERWIANNAASILSEFDDDIVQTMPKGKDIGNHLGILFNYFGKDGSQRLSLFSSFMFSLIVFAAKHRQSITFDDWFALLDQGITFETKRFTVKLSPRFFESYINVSFE